MDVAITGASGLIGTALTNGLTAAGHRPIAVVRSEPAKGTDQIRWKPSSGEIDAASFEGIDAVVHLAGAPVVGRWTEKHKKAVMESRRLGTTLLTDSLASLNRPPVRMLSGSAIGYYGHTDVPVDEAGPRGSGFLPDVVETWERSAQAAVDADAIHVAFLRTGIVLSRSGGALKPQLPLFKLGLGGRIGSGDQWMSWISERDMIGAILWLLANDVTGPVNMTAPHPVTNAGFTKALGDAVNRPTIIPVPTFGLKLLFGGEFVDEVFIGGQHVVPQVLLDGGYSFIDATLAECFSHLLG